MARAARISPFAAHTRAREAGRRDACSTCWTPRRLGRCSSLRPHDGEVAGGASSRIVGSDILVRGDDGARAVGAIDDDDVGFPAGLRRWWRRRAARSEVRVIDNDRKFRSTDVGQRLVIFAAHNARA